MKKILFIIMFFVMLLVSAACSEDSKSQKTDLKSVLIEKVPHIKQETDFCGEACVAMYLQKLGKDYSQDDVFNSSRLDPLKARGCYTPELKTALENIGFEKQNPYYYIDVNDTDAQIEKRFRVLYNDLLEGTPAIVCTHYDDRPSSPEHFRLILGYDAKKDSVIYNEPAESGGAYKKMSRKKFFEIWPLKYENKRSLLVHFRLIPDKIKTPQQTKTFTSADYAQHLMKLKQQIPDPNFNVCLSPPFVVIGNDSRRNVQRWADRTVKWSVDKFKQQYFPNDPCSIIDIWLFKDDASYRKYAREIFSDNPTTPFGYFSHTHNALIMNIATGGGTLVHEIVHPFIAANFPECPSWFNEGFASLYEQSSEENGRIVGLTNWRLEGLQKKIKAGTLPSFKTLTSTTTFQFYRASAGGDNYAQARYLCYYLQEKDLLQKFYNDFHKNNETDPTGYETLQKVLGSPDMKKFQKDWQNWIMTLTFP